jgi:hypothetical protein
VKTRKEMTVTKNFVVRLTVAAVCVCVTQLAVWQVKYRTGLQAAQGAKFDVAALPMELGQWSGKPVEVDARLFQHVGGFSMVNLAYTTEAGRHASVHLANFTTTDLTLPHDPRQCYAEAGWTILNDDWQVDSHGRRYRLMIVEREGVRLCLAYWYQLGPEVAASREEHRKIMLKLRKDSKPWPPLVKVLVQVPIDPNEESARETAEDLGFLIYNWITSQS